MTRHSILLAIACVPVTLRAQVLPPTHVSLHLLFSWAQYFVPNLPLLSR